VPSSLAFLHRRQAHCSVPQLRVAAPNQPPHQGRCMRPAPLACVISACDAVPLLPAVSAFRRAPSCWSVFRRSGDMLPSAPPASSAASSAASHTSMKAAVETRSGTGARIHTLSELLRDRTSPLKQRHSKRDVPRACWSVGNASASSAGAAPPPPARPAPRRARGGGACWSAWLGSVGRARQDTRVRAHDAPAQLQVQSRVLVVAAGVYAEVVRQRLICVCDDAAS
jgi:hypothetical protein